MSGIRRTKTIGNSCICTNAGQEGYRATMTTLRVGLIAVAFVVLTGCGPTATTPTGTSPAEPPAATQEPTATTAPPPQPATEQPPAAQSFVMPNLVGSNLQAAQDAMQALVGDPLFITTSHDASGKGRHQVLDRDWQVCSQNVKPGQQIILDTKIDFGAVKTTERCP
jgi:hypothetical protein